MENAKKYLNQKTLIIAAMLSGLLGFVCIWRLFSSTISLVLGGSAALSDFSSAMGSVKKGFSLIGFMNVMSIILIALTIFILVNVGYQIFAENKKSKENIVYMIIYAFVTFSIFRGIQLISAIMSISKGNFMALSKFESLGEGGIQFLIYSLIASYAIVYLLAVYFACYAYYKQIDLPFMNQLKAKVINTNSVGEEETIIKVQEEVAVEETEVQEEPAVEETEVQEESVVEETEVQEEPTVEETEAQEEPAVEETEVQEEPETLEDVVNEKNDALTCKVCGTAIKEGQKFCSTCGANLEMQKMGGAKDE